MKIEQDMRADVQARLAQLRDAEAQYLLILESDPNALYAYYASILRNITQAVAYSERKREQR